VKDVLSFTVRKVKPSGTAGVISCASAVVGIVFAVVCFFVAVSMRGGDVPDHLLTSMIRNGMSQSPPVAPLPQLTFCPMWRDGQISGISCQVSNRSQHETAGVLLPKTLNSTWTSDKYPKNLCMAFNFDGGHLKAWNDVVFCGINATNTDGNNTWPSTVRVFIDKPGTTNFDGCESCVNGIDGTLVVHGYFTAGFYQANLIDVGNGVATEYKTSQNRLPLESRIDRPVFDNMVFLGGFYSADVWKYQHPSDFQAVIAGEQFGAFSAMVGGLGLVAWAIYACLSTTLILIVVGRDGLPSSGQQRTPLL